MRVIVVDDASFMRRVYSDIVKERGHEVVGEASTGKEAIEHYKHLRPDLVIMDVVMPDTSGLEAVKAILSYDKSARIIIVTAAEDKNIREDALALGAKALVRKPPDPEVLGEHMERMTLEAEAESPSVRLATVYSMLLRETLRHVEDYFDEETASGLTRAIKGHVEDDKGLEIDGATTLKLWLEDKDEANHALNELVEAGRRYLAGKVGNEQADEILREAFKLVYQQTPPDVVDSLAIMFPPWLESEVVRMERANWEASRDMIEKNYGLERGHIYLVAEADPDEAYRILSIYTLTGTPGLVISRSHPDEIREVHRTGPAETIWLTHNKVPEVETVEPSGSGILYKRISEFLEDHPESVILLDGLEYLISQTTFSGTQKLLHAIHDDVMLSDALVILPMDLEVLDQKQIHFLSRELRVIEPRDRDQDDAPDTEK